MHLKAELDYSTGHSLSKRTSRLPQGRIQVALEHTKKLGEQVAPLLSPQSSGHAWAQGDEGAARGSHHKVHSKQVPTAYLELTAAACQNATASCCRQKAVGSHQVISPASPRAGD